MRDRITFPMQKGNLHTHTFFSDGAYGPEVYITQALKNGLDIIGFSDHAPIPGDPVSWAMPLERLLEYTETLRRLQNQYSGRIRIGIGLEVDYIPGRIHPQHPSLRSMGFDYIIGAVHFLAPFPGGGPCPIDSATEFRAGLHQIYRNDVRAAVYDYYDRIREMVSTYPPDIIAHFDRIKMHNPDQILWSEDESWYRELVMDTLAAIKKQGVHLEINSKGMYQNRHLEPYPSYWIIREAAEMHIPMHLASDAHHPAEIIGGFRSIGSRLAHEGIRLSSLEDILPNKQPMEIPAGHMEG